jgi:uncharacterized protein (DUF934 family)
MAIIHNGKVVREVWIRLGDEIPQPDSAYLITLAQWRERRDALLSAGCDLALQLECDEPPDTIADDLPLFSMVALRFPKFTDGRPFSYARRLKEQMGFGGELRAVGSVLQDQIPFLVRCGFDSLEAPQEFADAWAREMSKFSNWYQPTGESKRTILYHRRHRSAAYDSPALLEKIPP